MIHMKTEFGTRFGRAVEAGAYYLPGYKAGGVSAACVRSESRLVSQADFGDLKKSAYEVFLALATRKAERGGAYLES
jgi:hypothetical protein